MPSQPTVLDGMRAPRSVRLEDIRNTQPDAAGDYPVAVAPAGVTVYVSKYRRYRVQITAPQSYIGPDGRKNTGGKRIEAQFDEGVYRNDAHDPKVRALIDEELQKNKYFGAFGTMCDYWLASDQQAKTEARRIQSAMDTLKALPRDVVEQHMAQLQHGNVEDHTLPPLDATAPSAGSAVGKISPLRPIPDA